MPDLTSNFLPGLQAHRLPGLDLGADFIYPQYNGQSILNIPSSVCRLLGAPDIGPAGALLPEVLQAFEGGAQKVVLILMDALPFERFRRWLAEGRLPAWSPLVQDGVLAPITSITPSTTSAAITSLWTGRGAAEHGITGYELWLKEYGLVANMISHRPMSFMGGTESLAMAGFEPEKYLPFPTLGQHLNAHGIKPYAFQHHSIVRSGLSRIFFKDVDIVPISTPADLWVGVRRLLESRASERLFVWAYWGEVDHFSHFYGPADERTQAEFAFFSQAMQELFIEPLSPQARRGTVLALSADHGQIETPKNPHYDLRNHPNLMRRLHINPTGENRLIYLYPRSGQIEAVREYIERTWPRQFHFIDPAYAVEAGLFGPGQPHPRLLDRLGDLIAAASGTAYLWWGDRDNPLTGRHGGLSPEEMLVPFVAAKL